MIQLGQTSKRVCQIAALSVGLALPDRLTADEQVVRPPAPPAGSTSVSSSGGLEALVTPQRTSNLTGPNGTASVEVSDAVPAPSPAPYPTEAKTPPQEESSGVLYRAALWLSKDFTSFSSPMEAARAIGLSLLSLAGGLLALSAGLRGVGKGMIELRKYMKENKDCVNGCDVAFPAVNEVVLFRDVRDGGKPKLMLQSRGVLHLTEVFPGRLHAQVVDRAARLCTKEQPFPQQHFASFLPKVGEGHGWRPEFVRSLTGAWPDVEITTDVYHTSLIEKAGAMLARPLKGEGMVEGALKTMVIVPIAEKPDRRSTLEFVVIRQDTFLRFADKDFVAELRANSPSDSAKMRRRIDQIELAYKVDREWGIERSQRDVATVCPTHFFPRLQILEKTPKVAGEGEHAKGVDRR